MVHFGIVFSADNDLVGVPQILHDSLDLRISTVEDHEKVITDFLEYTLMLVSYTTEKVTFDTQNFLVKLSIINEASDLCLHTTMVHWSCPKCKHGGKDREHSYQ